jgi:CBS domain-containing protein
MKLAIRSQRVLASDKSRVRLTVFCPAKRRSMAYGECAQCERVASLPDDPGAVNACIDCDPPIATFISPRPVRPQALERHREEPIASLIPSTVLCVHMRFPAAGLADALRETRSAEVPVVDDEGRLVGTLRRSALPPPPLTRAIARVPETAADWASEPIAVNEAVPIVDALELMVARHSRNLVVVRDDGCVIALLGDLDLLRWFTRARGRSNHAG